VVAIDLKSLIDKLNQPCHRALEAAAGLTLSRSHYNIEIEHWLLKLLDIADSDLALCLRHYHVDQARLTGDLNRLLDKLKTGNHRAPPFSPQIVQLARDAWLIASLAGNTASIRSGHLLAALIGDQSLGAGTLEMSDDLAALSADALRNDLATITAGSVENAAPGGAQRSAAAAPMAGGALDQYTIDLTERARAGRIDPVLGRDDEIRQVIDILARRRQNNPILTGEAGVGKTAVVEGFALRIAQGEVPAFMKSMAVRTLDLGLLQAGAGVKGEFENRLKSVIEEVKSSPAPIILFIDEAHTLIGAGGTAGQGDAANLLKPALARGDLRTIAATTWVEYKKYFERDAALARRFQVVKVDEPDEEKAIAMMHGLVKTLEQHHQVRVLGQAVIEAVRLSKRYIPGRQLPDKAVSVLDTACARVAMSQNAVPAAIEDRRRSIELAATQIRILQRERASGADHEADLLRLSDEKSQASQDLAELEIRWAREKESAARLRTLRDRLEAEDPEASGSKRIELAQTRSDLRAEKEKLALLQGEQPLLHVNVDGQAVAQVIANWTGIPLGRMLANEVQSILNLQKSMEERIVGQSDALQVIAQAMRTSRAKLTDPGKPTGVFLLVGASGVGKTETALALAELLYGGQQNLTVINMSEFKEVHKVSMLVGSPPGYVGYGEGGVLTEAVRRRPYGVVLLDEMEKAHPEVQDVFYQVFDKGQLRDGEGRDIDFKNTTIVMTSNAGADTIAKLIADPETMPDAKGMVVALHPELLKHFKAAFLGRVTVVPYLQLSDATLRAIVGLQLTRIQKRIAATYRAGFEYAPEVIDAIAGRCTEADSGARSIDRVLNNVILPEISSRLLESLASGVTITAIKTSIESNGGFSYAVS
jgi:type VI secretion system protein VasG